MKLTASFIDEIFKLGFVKKSFLEVLEKHLNYSYIPVELPEYKLILKSMIEQYQLNQKLPSYGVISQQHPTNSNLQNALSKIKQSEVIDQEIALKQLDQFIKDVKFQFLFEQVYDKYNEGHKEDAFSIFTKGAEELNSFSLKSNTGQFLRVFGDFKHIMKEKQIKKEIGEQSKEKVPFGIDILDVLTDGGMDVGDTALWIMPSGRGKSTTLKWSGMYACRLDYKVLHIQLEGSKKECWDKYVQIWTGAEYREIKWGDISKDKMMKIDRVLEDMENKHRELEIFSFEKYGAASMKEIREIVLEYQKIKGQFPDLIVLDSLDLCLTGENKKVDFDPNFKKDRLQTVAQRMKDMAVEFSTRFLTATQTGNISKQQWNNPEWVITRENTEADRTLVKPFAHVFTGNTTEDEKKKGLTRIFIDKLRYYDTKDMVYPIFTSYNTGKYYDRNKTLKEFSYMYEGKKE